MARIILVVVGVALLLTESSLAQSYCAQVRQMDMPLPGPCPARGSTTITDGLLGSTQSSQQASPISKIRSSA